MRRSRRPRGGGSWRRSAARLCARVCALAALWIGARGAGAATLAPPPVPAFPGAEGAGLWSLGGRGGRVYTVTHLGDDGPGSLREAVQARGPRVVVFAVAGTIELRRELRITEPRITVAGQTAPGPGITLRGHLLTIAADDVVVRFVRARSGDGPRAQGGAIAIVAGQRIVIDHVSASGSTDEPAPNGIGTDGPAARVDEVTLQWSLIGATSSRHAATAPGLRRDHGTSIQAGAGARVSLLHNLWVIEPDRLPRPSQPDPQSDGPIGGLIDIRSSLYYDRGRPNGDAERAAALVRGAYNIVDNCYWTHPLDGAQVPALPEASAPPADLRPGAPRIATVSTAALDDRNGAAQAWLHGNWVDGALPTDPWSLPRARVQSLPAGLADGLRRKEPLAVGPVAEAAAPAGCAQVLQWAGASLERDAWDRQQVDEVRQRSGRSIDSPGDGSSATEARATMVGPDAVGGADADGDGLPDAWERARGLDPADARDGAQLNPATGWTALDEWLAERAAGRMPPRRDEIEFIGLPRPPRATLHPALHLVGDSTMADKPAKPPDPERGWGQALRERLLEPQRLLNHAANGRSTTRFLAEGRWHHVLGQIAAGDWVLIQFGHNDARRDDPARYAPAEGRYRELLARFVLEARARGAHVLLATPLARRQFDDTGALRDTHGPYPAAVHAVAQQWRVPVLEMHDISRTLLRALGPQASKPLYMWVEPGLWPRHPQGRQDNTHTTAAGAHAMADAAVQEWRRLNLPLVEWLRPPP